MVVAQEAEAPWYPGSFTKNFSWGQPRSGLKRLYDTIRLGFNNELRAVARSTFRSRMVGSGLPQYIPINFFLFNKIISNRDTIIVDELVFQALADRHSDRFDSLALFAFNFSYAGAWKGAVSYQRRPALWAMFYVKERLAKALHWNAKLVSADDIENFIANDRRYTGKTTRKISTNLNYLYNVGSIKKFSSKEIERWWVDALFLAMDRILEDYLIDDKIIPEVQYEKVLLESSFLDISGPKTLEKQLAIPHLVKLYTECGGPGRFSDEHVRARSALRIEHVASYLANDDKPRGAVHPTNPRLLKLIPQTCAMLAVYAGFEVVHYDEMENFDASEFIRKHTLKALGKLQASGIKPTMSAEEVLRITRSR